MSQQLCGWVGKSVAEEHWESVRLAHNFVAMDLPASPKGKSALYKVARKVLGRDLGGERQSIGDCVSWGAKHATEYLSVTDILLRNTGEKFRPVFAPYYYGTSRVQIGRGRMGGKDGSSGSWMAAAVMRYGTLFSDEPGLPAYSAAVARSYGMQGPPEGFLSIGKKYLVQSAARIRSFTEMCVALDSGYPCTIASNQAFQMLPDSYGFHRPDDSQEWRHQMMVYDYGLSDGGYGLICNSWGDVHGHLKDFDTSDTLPVGTLRSPQETLENMIQSGECYAYSGFQGFVDQTERLEKALFRLA